jgi:hypothetical protein
VPHPDTVSYGLNIFQIHDTKIGLFARSGSLFLQVVFKPFSDADAVLENWKELNGAAPTKLGVPAHWTMTHPCAGLSPELGLMIVPRREGGGDGPSVPIEGLQSNNETVSFHATVPIPEAGKWSFRLFSSALNLDVGKPTQPITFVLPGLFGWLVLRWPTIVMSSGTLLIGLNLLVLVASRYSPGAWRLATDESWGKSVLMPQLLLLSHWQRAQLWLLDLYVHRAQRAPKSGKIRETLEDNPNPFLALPLTARNGERFDSNAVLKRLVRASRLWIQGSAGMGKTAIFLHLRQVHFGEAATSAFALFRRDGYVLVPIEARRFPEIPFSEQGGPSSWVVGCVRSILSAGGLSFTNQALLRAMLTKGTLAIAIDGLNEVAREQAVMAFAAEFPEAPIFVTSQEAGEAPFEVWRLPETICEQVDGLMELYLGEKRGKELAKRTRDAGLFPHLRSGYDVRLVIHLSESAAKDEKLPLDRLDLYRAAVAAAGPENDEKREQLEAAAWKLIAERGPNEDKRRMIPDKDAPRDLLAHLEAVRERSKSKIRLIRLSPPGYEFVHDQMNSYLAACWFVGRPTVSVMKDLLSATKVWQEGLETQRTLWNFVAEMGLSETTLQELWVFAGDDDRRAILAVALVRQAERKGWTLTRQRSKAPNDTTNDQLGVPKTNGANLVA